MFFLHKIKKNIIKFNWIYLYFFLTPKLVLSVTLRHWINNENHYFFVVRRHCRLNTYSNLSTALNRIFQVFTQHRVAVIECKYLINYAGW